MTLKLKKEEPEDIPDVEELELKEDDDDDESGDEFEEEDDEPGLGDILNHFLTDENGTNIADILSGLKKSIDNHNKILIKILNK